MQISVRHLSIPATLLILTIAPLPRMLRECFERSPILGMAAFAVAALLIAGRIFTVVRQYPNYFACFNSLGSGRPAYALATDSAGPA